MNLQIVFASMIILTIAQMVSANCCKGKHDDGCYGRGLCDANCCNCEGGCNKYLVLSSCGIITKAECAFKILECAKTCLDNGITSSQCKSCLGGLYSKCIGCLPTELGIDHIVNDTQSLLEIRVGCGAIDWIECAGILVGCAAVCVEPADPLCIACMGSLYGKCYSCVSLSKNSVQLLTNNTQVMVKNYYDDFDTVCQKSITAEEPGHCCKGMHEDVCYGNGICDANCCNCDGGCNRYLMLSSCGWSKKLKCALKVALCAGTCLSNGLKSSQCLKCFGSLYGECIPCVVSNLEANQIVADNTEMLKLQLGCSAIKWAECAARLALCAVPCVEPLDPLCITCMGSLYEKCKSCVSKNMDLKRLKFNTEALVKKRYSDFNGRCPTATLAPGNCCKGKHEDVCYGNGLCDANCCNCNAGCNRYLMLSSCGWITKLKCAVKVARCAALCLAHGILSSGCKTCFGSAYGECSKCLPGELDSVTIIEDNQKMMEMRLGCSILECAMKIASCATKCEDPVSVGCISCMGSLYEECKSCFFGDVNLMLLKNNTDALVDEHYSKRLNTSCSQSSSSYSVAPSSHYMMGLYLFIVSAYLIM